MDNNTHKITTDDITRRELPSYIRLNVFNYGWSRWNTWRGFWSNIKNIPKVFKSAWHRATKGYCTIDLYNLGDTYLAHILSTLIDFRNNTCSYPLSYASHSEWIAQLDKYIDDLIYITTDNDKQNEFNADYEKILSIPYANKTEEDMALIKKYTDRDTELTLEKREKIKSLFVSLSKDIPELWW